MRLWGETLTHLKLLVTTVVSSFLRLLLSTTNTKLCLPRWAWSSLRWTCFSCSLQSTACVCSYPASPDFLFCPLEVWPRLRVIKVAWHFWFSCFDIPNSLTNISNNSNQIGDSYIDLIFKAVLTFNIWCISHCPFWEPAFTKLDLVGVCQQMLRLVSSSHGRVVDTLRSL